MYERFDDKAKDVVAAAQEEAKNLRHNSINLEHIILGILTDTDDDIAGTTLVEYGLTLDKVRAFVKKNVPGGPAGTTEGLPFSTSCKKSLEFALRECLALGSKTIKTEHILLGILRDPDPVAQSIFDAFEADTEKLRETVLSKIKEANSDMAPAGIGAARSSGPSRQRGGQNRHLDRYARNLTELAREGKLDPVIGRQTEINRVMQILTRRRKNNPVLVGHAGVGKTSVVEGLAQRIVEHNVPGRIEGKEIFALDLAMIVAGTKYRGEFEERLKNLVKEVTSRDDVILFIDEIHTLVSAGAAEGALDAANILKPALARGELQTIGATTFEEHKKYFEKDAALERRFQKVTIDPPSVDETVEILKGLTRSYEEHHNVVFTPDAITSAVDLSDRYISDRFLPDKAIDLMDEAASHVYMNDTNTEKLQGILEELRKVKEAKTAAIESEEFEQAQEYVDREKELKQGKQALNMINPEDESTWPEVTAHDVASVVGMWTGIQVTQLTVAETDRLKNIEQELHKRIIGQAPAVSAVSKSIKRSKAGLHEKDQPLGSFVFLGPSGVGKTELGKTLAEFLFGDEKSLIRLDMSEYSEKHNVSRLIGSPPGYVGYGEGGQLTEKVRQKPYSVVLLDEIEKAHPDVWNILLQLLEEGELTDGQGRKVSFRNTIVIMTSNLGAEFITQSKHAIGFQVETEGSAYEDMKKKVLDRYGKAFPPELRNRIDEVVVFSKLTEEEISEIIDLLLIRLETLLSEKGLKLVLAPAARELLIKEGYDPQMGARPLRRAIRRLIEEPLADHMLGVLKEGSKVKVNVDPNDPKQTRLEIVAPRKAKRVTKNKKQNGEPAGQGK